MHGPEHHVRVGAALLTAWHNGGGQIDFPAALEEMKKRGSQIPGGICGLWGTCGAAVSAGIFFQYCYLIQSYVIEDMGTRKSADLPVSGCNRQFGRTEVL